MPALVQLPTWTPPRKQEQYYGDLLSDPQESRLLGIKKAIDGHRLPQERKACPKILVPKQTLIELCRQIEAQKHQ
jgi:hypothetical protein